ncbi:hypothetical protein CPB84DRAFT_360809 [Gymnopilus junonius]|uniref:Uncharacterized protein n=1 Tax=Gymnopilus junonius TaxID=109634 RepID=A0A9P5NVI7_GYMJU|nr:hypothetical protein CPB84DRAFT_360809 [Gymnopilus junonius]
MVSTPRKRNASRSPDGGRLHKRLLTSSPEEGEVADTGPSLPNPTIPPISLPSKPKVPFPFKKKVETAKNGTVAGPAESQAAPMNVFAKFEENAKKDREDPRRQRSRPIGKSNGGDRWEPSFARSESLLSRIGPPAGGSHYHPTRDSWDSRDRDRRRSPFAILQSVLALLLHLPPLIIGKNIDCPHPGPLQTLAHPAPNLI